MKKAKRLIFQILLLGFAIINTTNAQPGDPGGGGDPDVPIQGIGLLIALGLAFGIRKIYKSNRK